MENTFLSFSSSTGLPVFLDSCSSVFSSGKWGGCSHFIEFLLRMKLINKLELLEYSKHCIMNVCPFVFN